MAFASGKNANLSVESTNLTGTDFHASEQGDMPDATNFESNGFREGVLGIQSLTISYTGVWDSTTVPSADPPGLFVRDNLQNVFLTPDISLSVGSPYSMPKAMVPQSTVSGNIRGAVQFSGTLESQGTYSTP